MKEAEIEAFWGFTALSCEELESVDGGASLNKHLGIPDRISEDAHDGVLIGTDSVTIHDNDVDVPFSGKLYPPEVTVEVTIRL